MAGKSVNNHFQISGARRSADPVSTLSSATA
jgi:hypothetical protein